MGSWNMWSICHFSLEASMYIYMFTSVLCLLDDKPPDRNYVYFICATSTPGTRRIYFVSCHKVLSPVSLVFQGLLLCSGLLSRFRVAFLSDQASFLSCSPTTLTSSAPFPEGRKGRPPLWVAEQHHCATLVPLSLRTRKTGLAGQVTARGLSLWESTLPGSWHTSVGKVTRRADPKCVRLSHSRDFAQIAGRQHCTVTTLSPAFGTSGPELYI